MGNEISGRQRDVSTNYGIPLDQLQKWYHGEYINFLKQEIAEQTWNTKYENELQSLTEPGDKFCKWKDIQKEIFEAVLDNHRFLLYSWEEYAKGLIDEAQIKVAARHECEQDKEEHKNQDDEGSSRGAVDSSTTTTKGSSQTIDLKGCFPKRRDTINKKLRDIKKLINYIQDPSHGNEQTRAQSAAISFIANLALQTENEIENLRNQNISNTDNVCKLYRRTYADYKDISKGTDIVNHHLSNEVQELLEGIRGQVKESQMDNLWEKHFKDTIEKKLKELENSKKDSNKQAACTLDHSEEKSPQCLRYMEEFLEEFIQTKHMLEWYIQHICNSTDQNEKNKCTTYCTQYQRFLSGRKTCYNKYKNQCQQTLKPDSRYREQHVYETEINDIEKKIIKKSGCGNTCGQHGNINLSPLFEENNFDTNKLYYCHCGNGKDKKKSSPCNDQKQKSPMVLKGNWTKGIIPRKGVTSTKPTDVCQLDWRQHATGGSSENANPCLGIHSNSPWECDDTREKGICIPPRRRAICISNIRHLEYGDISNMDSDKLLLEVMLAAKQEAWRIRNHKHKGRPQSHDVCRDIRLSFLDFGDIIKGTDKASDNKSVETEQKLRDIFEKIREQWKKSGDTKYNDTTAAVDGLGELRKDWWEENKEQIWEAFKCGNNWCNNGKVPDDSRSQFLRWLEEWVNEFCTEKKTKEQLVNTGCSHCSGIDHCEHKISWWIGDLIRPPDSICDCKYKCRDYSEWIHVKKTEFDKQKNYYDTKLTILDFGGHTSGTTPSGTSISSVSQYLNDKSRSRCSSVDFNDVPKVFSSYPDDKTSPHRHKCSRCYAQLEADLAEKGGPKKDVCDVRKILTNTGTHIADTCSDATSGIATKTNDDTEWKDKQISDTSGSVSSGTSTIFVPPRYNNICKKNIETNDQRDTYMNNQEYYENNRMLLSEMVLVGKSEGQNLRQQYSGGNNNSVLCTSIRRSFADIGDIVKGTNIVDTDDDNDVEKYLKQMFYKLRQQYYWFGAADANIYYGSNDNDGLRLFRKNWWERNRHMVWGAMQCDDPNKCSNHNDIDRVPQLLRWAEEWSEQFYKEQQNKIKELNNACKTCNMDSGNQNQSKYSQCNPKYKCEECKTKCNVYKEWIQNWKDQWDLFKKYYDEKKNQNKDKDSTYNTLFEYIVKKLKGRGYNDITSFNESDVFANYPNGYKTVCNCDPNTTSSSSSTTNDQNTCNDNYKSKWNCNVTPKPPTNTNMCLRNDSGNSGNMDDDTLFFNSFTQWLDELSYNLNENSNTLSQTCDTKNIRGKDAAECKECRTNCECYETWKKEIKDQWEKQKGYYNTYKNTKSDMKHIELKDFLYAYCWSQDKNRNDTECSPKGNDTQSTIIDEKIDVIHTRNMNMCGICPEDETKKKDGGGSNCDNIKTDGLTGQCSDKYFDNIKNSGYEKDWTNAKKNNTQEPGVYVPPRRQQLCVSYLAKNAINGEEDLKKYLKASIKGETEKLYKYYNSTNTNSKPVNSDDTNTDPNGLPKGFCKAVERSFADIGNIVKGTNLDNSGETEYSENNIKTFFQNNTSEKNPTKWWEKNKRDLWKGVKCGIKDGGGKDGLDCPQNIDFDRRDQFLRWFEEWGEYICIEHTKELKELTTGCKGCDNGKKCNGATKTCDSGNCTNACDKYKSWINKRKDQWNKLSEKYNQYKKSGIYGDDEATFLAKHMPPSTYLKFFNIDTCSKTLFNTLFYEKYEYGDQQKLCECEESKRDIENTDKTDIPAPDNITSNPCNVNTDISSCHQKEMDGIPWTSTYIRPQNDGSSTRGVFAPPRRQKLCVGNIWLHAMDKNTLLKELMFAAKTEATYLKNYYDKQSGTKHSGKNNELCKAITRSFYDLGDIVKGTDLRRGIIVTATENKIYTIFKDTLGSTKSSDDDIQKKRQDWWNDNKDKVWKALTCDNKCKNTTTPNDTTPQVLRWYEEWYDDFCENRNKLLEEIRSGCSGKSANAQCGDNDSKCESACSKYSIWLSPKNFEWKAQKKNYESKTLNKHQEGHEFNNVTRNKNTIEKYLQDKSSGIKCDKDKINDMDNIVEKKDKDYKDNYEPLCSKCRKKQLIDKINENKNKQKPAAAAPSNSSTPQAGGTPISSGQPSTSGVAPPASVTQPASGSNIDSRARSDPGQDSEARPPNPPKLMPNPNPNHPSSSSSGTPVAATQTSQCQIETYIQQNDATSAQMRNGKKYCNSKVKADWKCDKESFEDKQEGPCMPPRRQKMCIKYLTLQGNSDGIDKLKDALLKSVSLETYFLWEQYKKNNKREAETLQNGTIPPDFLRTMFYIYSDFRDLILDKDILQKTSGTDTKKARDNIDKVFKQKNGGQDPSTWWDGVATEVWEAMVCALTHGIDNGEKDTVQQKLKDTYDYTNVKFNTSDPTSGLAAFAARPQFLRWLTEWYDDYCHKKHIKLEDVKTKCKKVDDKNFQCDDTECTKKCEAYEKYMEKKKTQWDKQDKYYTSQKNGATSTTEYSGTDATQYLKTNITFTCGSTPKSDEEVQKNINALTTSSSSYYDADSHCGCKKYIEDAEYDKISGGNNCTGLKKTAESKGIKWIHSEGGQEYNYLKSRGLTKHEYVPPRRQKLCIEGLDDKKKVTNTQQLREQLLKVSATEGYNLGEYYKNKDENKNGTNADKYSYDVSPCNAMKYSFYDLRDIILGYDMLEPKETDTEKKIKQIIDNSGEPGSQKRKDFWNNNEKCVWNAMKCGYRKGRDDGTSGTTKPSEQELQKCDQIPNDSDYPIGKNRDEGKEYQFLRWFTEWAEDFCAKQKKELEKLKNHCSFNECEKASSQQKDQCLNACGKYKRFINKWKPQYRKQNIMYEGLPDSINLKKDSAAPEFIKKNCNDKCIYFDNKKSTTIDELFETPPKDYEEKCKCTNTPPPPLKTVPQTRLLKDKKLPPQPPEDTDLDKCPLDNSGTTKQSYCNYYGKARCRRKTLNKELDEWTNRQVKDPKGENKGVLIPPRRRQLCFPLIRILYPRLKDENKFKEYLLHDVSSEAKMLWNIYGNNPEKALEAMKYSFADYGNIVKGDDRVDDLEPVKKQLNKIFKKDKDGNPSGSETEDRKKWWETNKKKVWNVMLCHYNGDDKSQNCEDYKEIDEIPQFLRWLEEWSQLFCYEKVNEAKTVVKQCIERKKIQKATKISDIKDKTCKDMLQRYKKWYLDRNTQWKGLKEAYKKYKENNGSSGISPPSEADAQQYVTSKCSECDCNYSDLEKISQYQKQDEKLLNELTNIATTDSTDRINPWEAIKYLFQNIKTIGRIAIGNVIPDPKEYAQKVLEKAAYATLNVAAQAYKSANKIHEQIQEENISKNSSITPTPVPPVPPPPPAPIPTPGESSQTLNDQPNLTNNILSSTIPVGISVALGSIALLFYLKKKPKRGPTDIFRVLELPQNDYTIPTYKSTNRYVPYSRYKGKTYIYVEGDEPDNYIGDISSSDITSSSESEYDEIDINDIYKPLGPKYKTLIEVVLKPSSKSTQDTQDDTTYIQTTTPTNTPISDEEWNQLKHDFISQYLENIPKDVPNENLSGTPTTDTQPNTVDNSFGEKPFITSIQDRDLRGDSDVTYNIDWNVPENITTNTADVPKSNSLYTGIDLINDSLNNDQHVDIYDELLKRKENELFGTNHTKHTTKNRVAKQIGGDPIMKQLELFHTWLDRNRNMCNQWNNKKDILNKLKEKWDIENNNNRNITLDSNSNTHNNDIKMLNTDISIQINMDVPKTINEFTNINTNPDISTMDNILDDLENYIYYDVDDDQISVDHNKVHMETNIVNNKKELCQQEYPI
ncbi:erythrocyte membrane protein 1, PfEMP1, putative [Plasmodium gaboni]|uniref:Erythrocyte membrane protein 1, PfEMP1, putative n=1 Tax=Plasmodium gaboni TaxID=647221 RepID=A0ABY1UIR4_9APIC|nr:erythrocyte membrane protein 1, PfEMP1, putative [Plasmodium gaboni]